MQETAPQTGATSQQADPAEVSVKVLSAFSHAKPLAEATPIFDGHDFMLDMKMSSWEKAYLADLEQFVDHNATQELVTGEMHLHDRHVVM